MHSWRNGRRSRLRSGRRNGVEVQVLPGAPTIARFAKRPRHRSYTPTFPGSSPGASTNGSRLEPPKHLPDMQGTRGSSPRRSTSISPVAQRQSARPITGRPRFDTVRENQHHEQGDHHGHQDQTGAVCRRISIADGPGAFKPETVGQWAFNPRARGSTPPGSPKPTITCTRLAQLVERRPLKSEVRGSSPRSCTNLIGLRRIC
jgi:hypothetical protein